MTMNQYFEDLRVVATGVYPRYRGTIAWMRPAHYSIELVASGRMYFERRPDARLAIDYPALRWQAPNHYYTYGCLDELGWEHYYVLLEGARAQRLYERGLVPLVADGCVMPVRRVDLFRDLFLAIHHLTVRAGPGAGRAALYVEELLWRAVEEARPPDEMSGYRPQFETLCKQIHADLGTAVDFRGAAARMGVSFSHFRKLFSQYTGRSPQQYVLRARLAAAETLLRQTDLSIKQIGYELGLGNPSQFSKTFRAAYGWPPGALRTSRK